MKRLYGQSCLEVRHLSGHSLQLIAELGQGYVAETARGLGGATVRSFGLFNFWKIDVLVFSVQTCVLCASVVDLIATSVHHRGTENPGFAQS